MIAVGSFASAQALTVDTSGMTGDLSYADGYSSAVASIEHISSDASELDFMYNDFVGNGRTYQKLPDLTGTLQVNNFGISTYGVDSTTNTRCIGLNWGFSATGASFDADPNLSYLLYNTVVLNASNFYAKDNNDNTVATWPFNPTPDVTSIGENYGWVIGGPDQMVDTRYLLFGKVVTDANGNQEVDVADGVKMTLTATLNPVPEPAPFAVMAIGIVGLASYRKAKR